MFLDGNTITVITTFLSKLCIVNHVQSGNNRTGIQNLFKLFFNKSFVKFLGTLGKFLTGIGIILVWDGSGHITFCLTVPVKGVVQTSVLTILRTYIIYHSVGIAVLQCKLLGSIIVGVHDKLYHYIRVIAQEGTLFYSQSNRETACLILFFILESCDIFIENIFQLFSLRIIVHHLILNELCHLHFFLTIEHESVRSSLFALFTANNIIIAKELYNFLHLILDGEARSIHIVYQK